MDNPYNWVTKNGRLYCYTFTDDTLRAALVMGLWGHITRLKLIIPGISENKVLFRQLCIFQCWVLFCTRYFLPTFYRTHHCMYMYLSLRPLFRNENLLLQLKKYNKCLNNNIQAIDSIQLRTLFYTITVIYYNVLYQKQDDLEVFDRKKSSNYHNKCKLEHNYKFLLTLS